MASRTAPWSCKVAKSRFPKGATKYKPFETVGVFKTACASILYL
jgi:hypothetical protein